MKSVPASALTGFLVSCALSASVAAAPLTTAKHPSAAFQPGTTNQRAATVAEPGAASRTTPPGVAAPLNNFVLNITVGTGDDDLRSNSSAWLRFHPSGSNKILAQCRLREVGGDTWGSHTSHVVNCSARLHSLDELKQGWTELAYDGWAHGTLLEQWDNWNVDELRVDALDASTHQQQCVLDIKGSPFVRLKKEKPVFQVKISQFPC